MATLIGILLDVSGSMRSNIETHLTQNITEGTHGKPVTWSRSIFSVVDGLIRHDVSSDNHVFALGVGAKRSPVIFDVLNTLARVDINADDNEGVQSLEEIIIEVLLLLRNNGAPNIATWGRVGVIAKWITREDAVAVLAVLRRDQEFLRAVVRDVLPSACRNTVVGVLTSGVMTSVQNIAVLEATHYILGTDSEVHEVIDKILDMLLVGVTTKAIMSAHAAYDLLRGCAGDNEVTDVRMDGMLRSIERFIYGNTPFIEAIRKAAELFKTQRHQHHNKLLFIVSDGKPTDGNHIPAYLINQLEGVTIFCCYITKRDIDNPRRLYSNEQYDWESGARLMFRLSSTITTTKLPRTIFVKRGWEIDGINNETKLFVQVNHPSLIYDICEFARDVICCEDAIADLLSTISLDLYINEANDGFSAKRQVGSTCYANAAAAVLHLSMSRIVGREGGYPSFFHLRDEMVDKYGKHGAKTLKVLQEICPMYRLHCQQVDQEGALQAVVAKRPVLATFRLTDDEWDQFSGFYRANPRGILTNNELDIRRRCGNPQLGGHAVVLTSFDSKGLRFMNSWGSHWADNGFFRVRTAQVLDMNFIDVYWTVSDLFPAELSNFQAHGAKAASSMFKTLKGLQNLDYECPRCGEASNVTEFSGMVLRPKCPKCLLDFPTTSVGDDIVLNLYLTSLLNNN